MTLQDAIDEAKRNAQRYTLCGLTAAGVEYIEKTIIDMDASRSRRKV